MASKLLIRILSAVVGAAGLVASYWFFGSTGLLLVCVAVSTLALFEVAKLLLPVSSLDWARNFFVGAGCITFSVSVFFPNLALAVTTTAILCLLTVFMMVTQWDSQQREHLDRLLRAQALATLGVLYGAVLPSFVARLLNFPHGDKVFFVYLGIVFGGDTFAYFFGKYLGERKLMPSVSPKKTVAGSLGGLLGSFVLGMVGHYLWLQHLPVAVWIPLCLITGALAQAGDLFESVLKRVAQVKDSGQLMPGHGGLLDRLDGVYFAAPLFFVAVYLLH